MAKASKTVLLASDGRTNVQIDALAKRLNQVCKHLKFESHPTPIDLIDATISNPETYKKIKAATDPLLARHSFIAIATERPYNNNYFSDANDRVVIFSFWGWSSLTNLPMNNGMVGFIDGLLASDLDADEMRHDDNTGCVYDFLWDKRGIDARLRSSVICRDCFGRLQKRASESPLAELAFFDCTVAEGYEDLITILDEVSQASKREVDILTRWQTKAGVPQDFDVFLCHNSNDKPSVRDLYKGLISRGLSPWFDEEHLRPGIPWQRELEDTIPRINAAAVVVGPNGQGPWQEVELAAFLREFVNRGCAVIPVLLKDAADAPKLPLFLQSFTWVDFRKTEPDPWRRLVWGITGKKPI